ncbi:MAG: hypothetical protein GYA16_14365 [Spirochaetes bacterium]|nr:hypothetical protein [Spirochaetota bacterium]
MKLLQNPYIRNNSITIIQALIIAASVIVLLHVFNFLHIIIIAFIVSLGLQLWCQLNPCYADYITSTEAPLASLALLITMLISHSMSLSIVVTFIVLFIYHYFFSSYELYHDIYFTALLFSTILMFVSLYLNNIGIFNDYTIKIFTGVQSNTSSSIAIISILMSILYTYLSKLKYEFRIISLGHNYINLLGIDENIIHGISSIAKALISTMIFILIGWMGSLLTTIPLLRKSSQPLYIMIFTAMLSLLLYAIHFVHPFYIIIPVVIIDFVYVFFLGKRLPCSR